MTSTGEHDRESEQEDTFSMSGFFSLTDETWKVGNKCDARTTFEKEEDPPTRLDLTMTPVEGELLGWRTEVCPFGEESDTNILAASVTSKDC
jgi:hypothetical protein